MCLFVTRHISFALFITKKAVPDLLAMDVSRLSNSVDIRNALYKIKDGIPENIAHFCD